MANRAVTHVPFPIAGPDALSEITEFCDRSLAQKFSSAELEKALFAPDQPALVRFSQGLGLLATVRDGDSGSIRLIAVDPDQRKKGHGTTLLRLAASDLEGSLTVTVGADPPYFLFPGVPTTEPELCYLLERHHFVREEINFNVAVDLACLPDEPSEAERPDPEDRGLIDAWSLENWPNWRREFLRAFDQRSLLVSRDDRGIACASRSM